ncbi:2OG-Fe(II) oxygenase family protein [Emcibacter sp. SYSU 3D8]|uniref:2OG-Fe(II) oxygenase family protein n=1 Tax=Emcibacter sp. SYSU 3D8 TaxID=3133969 RepID=UPI0031FE9A36
MPPSMLAAEPCFASPIFTFEIDGAEALNAAMIRDIEAYRHDNEGMQRSNQHGWHSPTDFFRRPEASFRALADQINSSIAAATRQIAPKLDLSKRVFILQGWINVNGPGAYNTPHAHPDYEWSGSYYVKVPDSPSDSRSGCIEFLDPRGPVHQMEGLGSTHFVPKIRKRPRAGLIYLFPSYLRHWVYPNEQDDSRISIAFNAKFRLKEPIRQTS